MENQGPVSVETTVQQVMNVELMSHEQCHNWLVWAQLPVDPHRYSIFL